MIKIDRNYTDYRDDTDPKYPGGKAVDATTVEGTDGTPLLANWMNDINGTRQAIFIEAFGDINGVSGKPDNVQESDVLKAIKKITKDYTDNMLIKIFQNGYVQWPWMPKPETVFYFEGYRWAEVNYDGCFFRAKGQDSAPFDGDIQQEGLPNIIGHFYSHSIGIYASGGALKETTDVSGNYRKFAEGSGLGVSVSVFDAANSNNIYGASKHVTPRNRTFIIWKLEKI